MNIVAFWVRSVISSSYQPTLESNYKAFRIKACKISSIAPSLLFKKNFTVSYILWAGMW